MWNLTLERFKSLMENLFSKIVNMQWSLLRMHESVLIKFKTRIPFYARSKVKF